MHPAFPTKLRYQTHSLGVPSLAARARRPVLRALTAVLAGALVAGTGTVLAGPASSDDRVSSAQDQVVALVNTARGEAGCGPVTANASLTAAAQAHASDMSARGYFGHTTPEGVTFDQRIRNAGYPRPGAENIARGPTTAEAVMALWLKSDGHRANILNCNLVAIGVGLDVNGFYWVQDFGF